MSSEQENEKSNDPKQTRLEYFLFPKTIAEILAKSLQCSREFHIMSYMFCQKFLGI